MTLSAYIANLLPLLPNIQDNILIIEEKNSLNLSQIERGILIVFASWSGPAVASVLAATKMLNDNHYKGQIIIVDNDCLTAEFQLKTFTTHCNGWGEIFVISNGIITTKYVSRNAFIKFQNEFRGLI